jgi:hypothetical protein
MPAGKPARHAECLRHKVGHGRCSRRNRDLGVARYAPTEDKVCGRTRRSAPSALARKREASLPRCRQEGRHSTQECLRHEYGSQGNEIWA